MLAMQKDDQMKHLSGTYIDFYSNHHTYLLNPL